MDRQPSVSYTYTSTKLSTPSREGAFKDKTESTSPQHKNSSTHSAVLDSVASEATIKPDNVPVIANAFYKNTRSSYLGFHDL